MYIYMCVCVCVCECARVCVYRVRQNGLPYLKLPLLKLKSVDRARDMSLRTTSHFSCDYCVKW